MIRRGEEEENVRNIKVLVWEGLKVVGKVIITITVIMVVEQKTYAS